MATSSAACRCRRCAGKQPPPTRKPCASRRRPALAQTVKTIQSSAHARHRGFSAFATTTFETDRRRAAGLRCLFPAVSLRNRREPQANGAPCRAAQHRARARLSRQPLRVLPARPLPQGLRERSAPLLQLLGGKRHRARGPRIARLAPPPRPRGPDRPGLPQPGWPDRAHLAAAPGWRPPRRPLHHARRARERHVQRLLAAVPDRPGAAAWIPAPPAARGDPERGSVGAVLVDRRGLRQHRHPALRAVHERLAAPAAAQQGRQPWMRLL